MNIQHRIDRPYEAGCIEVYGDEPYEWRILDHAGHVVRDSAGYGSGASAYASAELALRDAITFDADDSVVPIFFRHGADAELENAAQAHRTADTLRAMALALKSAGSQAVLDSRHATDDEAQDYLDARIAVMERIVQELEESAGRLHAATQAAAG
ncbi:MULTISPECIES: hypothetical protein [Halomonas]|uniref:hypothetical protein n=1 Tax=Halomonas TaxID=2745 RepID=UPI000E5AFB5C|nr:MULTISPECIES: hypothetical protein [Halomonas]AXY41370.1 hypothetical protein D1793_03725 [Halomonas sp. JS92-SW72]